MKVLIASDHAGYDLKEYLKKNLPQIEFQDLGVEDGKMSIDYPDYAAKLCNLMPKEEADKNPTQFGILACGSGQGMAMKANRFPHIRAAQCWDITTARVSREHNNANILCLGGRLIPFTLAKEMVEIFLKTEFAGGRHSNRVKKIT